MKKQSFSTEQKSEIQLIVQKEIHQELIPIRVQLARHEMIFEEHSAKLDALPTRMEILELFDRYLGAYKHLDTEVTTLTGASHRHEKEIHAIKKHVQMV